MSSTSPAPLQGKRILIIEDEFLIQLDIQNILEAAGARMTVTAGRVADALTALNDSRATGNRFDAAVLDLKLDKESALPVAERLTEMGIPFVFLTGAPATADEATEFRSAPVVGKPFDGATLLAALVRAMAS